MSSGKPCVPKPLKSRMTKTQVVHILSRGVSLCDISEHYGTPNHWPDGHVWVALPERKLATCRKCGEVAAQFERDKE
jgi:hypothetical protein